MLASMYRCGWRGQMLSGWFAPSSANALWSIFYLLGIAFITIAGYKIKTWPLVKQRITEAKIADDQIDGLKWKRFQDEIARLDQRVMALEAKLAAAEERANSSEARALAAEAETARLEAFITGRGQGLHEASVLSSARRIVKDDKDKR